MQKWALILGKMEKKERGNPKRVVSVGAAPHSVTHNPQRCIHRDASIPVYHIPACVAYLCRWRARRRRRFGSSSRAPALSRRSRSDRSGINAHTSRRRSDRLPHPFPQGSPRGGEHHCLPRRRVVGWFLVAAAKTIKTPHDDGCRSGYGVGCKPPSLIGVGQQLAECSQSVPSSGKESLFWDFATCPCLVPYMGGTTLGSLAVVPSSPAGRSRTFPSACSNTAKCVRSTS